MIKAATDRRAFQSALDTHCGVRPSQHPVPTLQVRNTGSEGQWSWLCLAAGAGPGWPDAGAHSLSSTLSVLSQKAVCTRAPGNVPLGRNPGLPQPPGRLPGAPCLLPPSCWQKEVPFSLPTNPGSEVYFVEPRALGLWTGRRCEPEQTRPNF